MPALIKILKKLAYSSFTGKVNIILKHNSQHQGTIFVKDGFFVNYVHQDKEGIDHLTDAILINNDRKNFSAIAEPETISRRDQYFRLSFSELIEKVAQRRDGKLKPPAHLKLSVSREFIVGGHKVTPIEFNLLKTIDNDGRVGEIYKNSGMLESLVTSLLISLRKKGALKVIGHK